jgi:PIN domain nuclease of toxin-antitoxin system
VIVLDTHVWVWWVQDETRLSDAQRDRLAGSEAVGIGVSAISCWEVAKLVEKDRLDVAMPLAEWLAAALAYPGIRRLPLTDDVIVESVSLPGAFHHDPADQLLVATARTLGVPLVTSDRKILAYPHVDSVG